MNGIEWIKDGDQVLAIIIRAEYEPQETEFITPDSYKQQAGFIVYAKGGSVAAHRHRDLERSLRGTSEVLLVRRGRCWIDLYRNDKTLHHTGELQTGDVVVLISGGHGFRMIEDTVFLEIKQGPYIGDHEKERFDATPK